MAEETWKKDKPTKQANSMPLHGFRVLEVDILIMETQGTDYAASMSAEGIKCETPSIGYTGRRITSFDYFYRG